MNNEQKTCLNCGTKYYYNCPKCWDEILSRLCGVTVKEGKIITDESNSVR